MCGIAGFLTLKANKSLDERRETAKAMENSLAHRGPDWAESWLDGEGVVSFVHRRLSIIDLSAGGRQPMHSSSGRYVIVTNGEIYNYLELQAELEAIGQVFKSRSDTEVMLAAFDHWGVNQSLQKFNGMFAFVLWDRQERQIHFVRDRFGKKPLYVGWAGQEVVFGSELSVFHAHEQFEKKISKDVLSLYMHYGYVHAPHSIFENVWQMMPGERLTLDLDRLSVGQNFAEKMQPYWLLREAAETGKTRLSRLSDQQVIKEFEEKYEKAVIERMISDVPLGAFLSGGIDSSSVVALMQKNAASKVRTFSIGFEEAEYNEAVHAKKVAAHLETDHQEFYVTVKEAQDVIPLMPEIYDEPFADQSQIPTYLISKLAREQVTVVLTGDGGDEILAGYDRHVKIPALWRKMGWLPYPLRTVIGAGLSAVPSGVYAVMGGGGQNFGRQVQRAFSLMRMKGEQEIYDALVSAWPLKSKIVMQGVDPAIALKQEKYWPQGLNFTDAMIFGDQLSYRPNDLMVKTDRATMHNALEARAPLMDYKLAEYCWSLPQEMKIRNGKGKWLLRQVLKKYVPPELYDRPKMGFTIPLDDWLRGPLKGWGEDLLSEQALDAHGLLDKALIRRAWIDFHKNRTFQDVPKHLWSVLMFQAWYQKWM